MRGRSDGWKGETEVDRGAKFTTGFDIDEITQIGWFRFVEEMKGWTDGLTNGWTD